MCHTQYMYVACGVEAGQVCVCVQCLVVPYSTYTSRVFIFANFANLEPFAKLFQRKLALSAYARRRSERVCKIISAKMSKTAFGETFNP